MPQLIEVKIDSLRVSLTNQQRIVVLKEINTDRYLPIWIGPYEAEAITIALQEIEVSRPQTHDLLNNVISILGGRIIQVIISALKDDIFYGTLIIEKEGERAQDRFSPIGCYCPCPASTCSDHGQSQGNG